MKYLLLGRAPAAELHPVLVEAMSDVGIRSFVLTLADRRAREIIKARGAAPV